MREKLIAIGLIFSIQADFFQGTRISHTKGYGLLLNYPDHS